MKYDYEKIIATINNEENQPIHISAIKKMIQNFERKWVDESDLFEYYMNQIWTSFENLIIKFNV
jgi:hypothetical protein